MRDLYAALACGLITASCAAVTSHDCQTDAYLIGIRDGRMGVAPQADAIAARCSRTDTERYMDGWRKGNSDLRWAG